MEEEKPQKELFEFDKPKKTFPRLSNILPKADFERNILLTLSIDKAVFITIGIIMILVIAYALGVERGRSGALTGFSAKGIKKTAQNTTIGAVKAPSQVPVGQQILTINKTPQIINSNTSGPAFDQNKPKPFSIIAGSFSKNENALGAVSLLRREGLKAFVVKRGAYFQVLVGSYESKTAIVAEKDLLKVRRSFKDAYIKMR